MSNAIAKPTGLAEVYWFGRFNISLLLTGENNAPRAAFQPDPI